MLDGAAGCELALVCVHPLGNRGCLSINAVHFPTLLLLEEKTQLAEDQASSCSPFHPGILLRDSLHFKSLTAAIYFN